MQNIVSEYYPITDVNDGVDYVIHVAHYVYFIGYGLIFTTDIPPIQFIQQNM